MAGAESAARFAERTRSSTQKLDVFERDQEGWTQRFTIDPDFGFRPLFGGRDYDERGFLHNAYPLQKTPGVERVLFLGDSVTRRGRIVAAIRERYGEANREYWNAGVESFSLVQSVRYFLRYAQACDPDHVVFTFHYNDFQTTPVTFLDEDDEVVLYAPTRPRQDVNAWLYKRSSLYRRVLKTLDSRAGNEAIVAEMSAALGELRAWTDASGARLSVLLFPYLAPREQGLAVHDTWREQTLALCREHGLRTFDLLPTVAETLAAGVAVEERPGDTEHPSDALAEAFAVFLEREGLLAR
ncbi:MAG: hypothetical protein AAF682_28885 [Planctomycetota bacterium]